VIKRMSVEECAEMIERHINFVDKNGTFRVVTKRAARTGAGRSACTCGTPTRKLSPATTRRLLASGS
jgi:hypothetical protein